MYSILFFEHLARSGQKQDIDFIMNHLGNQTDIFSAKIADYSLGLVTNCEGKNRIRFYLFNGSITQRNYAALYFKRLGNKDILNEGVNGGFIEAELAFSE